MSVKVFIDGSSGTTGLRIADRLATRPDIELLSISAEGRKDVNERAKVINSADLAFLCLPDAASKEVMPLLRPDVRVLDTMKTLPANMRRAAAKGFINATDCADYLTKKGMPFRDAYKLTGCMVSDCIQKDKVLEELSLEEFKGYSALFENDIYDAIDLIKCCEGRTSYGGPSEASVRKQIELASAQLGAWEAENA